MNKSAIQIKKEWCQSVGSETKAFWKAALEQEVDVIKGFLLEKPDWVFNLTDSRTGKTPLLWSIHLNLHETLKVLLSEGASLDGLNQEEIPLLEAIESQSLDCFSVLIEAGADVNQESLNGMTPLIKACLIQDESLSFKMTQQLINAGADMNQITHKGWFALGGLASLNRVEGLKLLIKNNARLDVHGGDGFTALFYAIDNQAVEAVQCLLRAGAEYKKPIVMRTENGPEYLSPLDLATVRQNSQIVALIYSFKEAEALKEKMSLKKTKSTRKIRS